MAKTFLPVGLLPIKDLLSRLSGERDEFVAYEIERRKRERMLYHELRQVMYLHLWQRARDVVSAGAYSFVVALAVIKAADLARLYLAAQQYAKTIKFTTTIPIPWLSQIPPSLLKRLPTSEFIKLLARVPAGDWHLALAATFLVMALVLALRLKSILRLFSRVFDLSQALHDLDGERHALETWLAEENGGTHKKTHHLLAAAD